MEKISLRPIHNIVVNLEYAFVSMSTSYFPQKAAGIEGCESQQVLQYCKCRPRQLLPLLGKEDFAPEVLGVG